MIQLKKIKPTAPKVLSGKTAKDTLKLLKQKIDDGIEIKSDDFKSIWTSNSVKNKLYNHHNWKCCYCEQKREKKRDSDIEHFRPKTEIEGVGKPGYWWLAYDWNNLFIACKQCNQTFKGIHFPLLDERNRGNNIKGIADERPVLINPINQNPEEFITFKWTSGRNKPIEADIAEPVGIDVDGRGSGTIRICGLDRDFLNKERGGRILKRLYFLSRLMYRFLDEGDVEAIAETEEIIQDETSANSPFAGFKRAYFRDQGLGHYISND